jgi:hypothetical protein
LQVWRDYLRFACLAWRDEIFKIDGIAGALRGRAWLVGLLFTTWLIITTSLPF